MKNIIVALALFFALGASAQSTPAKNTAATKTISAEAAAEKDLKDLVAFVNIDEQLRPDVLKLFITKHREIDANKNELSPERKAYFIEYLSARLEGFIGAADFAKVKANTVLYNQLVF